MSLIFRFRKLKVRREQVAVQTWDLDQNVFESRTRDFSHVLRMQGGQLSSFWPCTMGGRPRGSRGREEIGPLEQGLLMWKDHRPRGPMESDACFLQDSHHLKWSESTLIQIK